MINFHRRIGLKPGFGLHFDRYGNGAVITVRLWWSALTLAWLIKNNTPAKPAIRARGNA